PSLAVDAQLHDAAKGEAPKQENRAANVADASTHAAPTTTSPRDVSDRAASSPRPAVAAASTPVRPASDAMPAKHDVREPVSDFFAADTRGASHVAPTEPLSKRMPRSFVISRPVKLAAAALGGVALLIIGAWGIKRAFVAPVDAATIMGTLSVTTNPTGAEMK